MTSLHNSSVMLDVLWHINTIEYYEDIKNDNYENSIVTWNGSWYKAIHRNGRHGDTSAL